MKLMADGHQDDIALPQVECGVKIMSPFRSRASGACTSPLKRSASFLVERVSGLSFCPCTAAGAFVRSQGIPLVSPTSQGLISLNSRGKVTLLHAFPHDG